MNYYLGQIVLMPYECFHERFFRCSNQILKINEYHTLYELIGAKFGGDDRITFALPDLDDASQIDGMVYVICIDGPYPPR